MKLYQRPKFAQTAAALNGVPSLNVTFGRSLNVHDRPFFADAQLNASPGAGTVVPGFNATSPW